MGGLRGRSGCGQCCSALASCPSDGALVVAGPGGGVGAPRSSAASASVRPVTTSSQTTRSAMITQSAGSSLTATRTSPWSIRTTRCSIRSPSRMSQRTVALSRLSIGSCRGVPAPRRSRRSLSWRSPPAPGSGWAAGFVAAASPPRVSSAGRQAQPTGAAGAGVSVTTRCTALSGASVARKSRRKPMGQLVEEPPTP